MDGSLAGGGEQRLLRAPRRPMNRVGEILACWAWRSQQQQMMRRERGTRTGRICDANDRGERKTERGLSLPPRAGSAALRICRTVVLRPPPSPPTMKETTRIRGCHARSSTATAGLTHTRRPRPVLLHRGRLRRPTHRPAAAHEAMKPAAACTPPCCVTAFAVRKRFARRTRRLLPAGLIRGLDLLLPGELRPPEPLRGRDTGIKASDVVYVRRNPTKSGEPWPHRFARWNQAERSRYSALLPPRCADWDRVCGAPPSV